MSVRTVVTRRRYRDITRDCPMLEVRVDRIRDNGPQQNWWVRIQLGWSAARNRQDIRSGLQTLRSAIRATAILG